MLIEARLVNGENGVNQTGNTIMAMIDRPGRSLFELGITLL